MYVSEPTETDDTHRLLLNLHFRSLVPKFTIALALKRLEVSTLMFQGFVFLLELTLKWSAQIKIYN